MCARGFQFLLGCYPKRSLTLLLKLKNFQFLLGCYPSPNVPIRLGSSALSIPFRMLLDHRYPDENGVQSDLSIPFRMLQIKPLRTLARRKNTFNSFWDATPQNRDEARPGRRPFNSFWDATVCNPDVVPSFARVLSIPFGMLHPRRGHDVWCVNTHFQFLLGCYNCPNALRPARGLTSFNSFWDATYYREYEKANPINTFNSFWDATGAACFTLGVSEGLSIPFGMLPHPAVIPPKSVLKTFNSFWDATPRLTERSVYLLTAFNSFWDATVV